MFPLPSPLPPAQTPYPLLIMQPGTAAQDARRQEPIDQSVGWVGCHTQKRLVIQRNEAAKMLTAVLLLLLLVIFLYV